MAHRIHKQGRSICVFYPGRFHLPEIPFSREIHCIKKLYGIRLLCSKSCPVFIKRKGIIFIRKRYKLHIIQILGRSGLSTLDHIRASHIISVKGQTDLISTLDIESDRLASMIKGNIRCIYSAEIQHCRTSFIKFRRIDIIVAYSYYIIGHRGVYRYAENHIRPALSGTSGCHNHGQHQKIQFLHMIRFNIFFPYIQHRLFWQTPHIPEESHL